MTAKYNYKDMGAWGDRQQEHRLERLAEATKTRKRRLCSNCKAGLYAQCTVTDKRFCWKPMDIVAREFSLVLRRWLGAKTMREVIRRNAAEPADSAVCHSHDFCDANMAMLEAFRNLGLRAICDIIEVDGPEWRALQNLWNAAWNAAVKSGFSTEAAR